MNLQYSCILGVLFALQSLMATNALAQSSADDQARRHYAEGTSLAEEEHFDAAYEQFYQGYRLSNRPLFLFNMGQCALHAEALSIARTAFERYLDEDAQGSMSATARAKLAEIETRASSAEVLARLPPSLTAESTIASEGTLAADLPATATDSVPTPEETARAAQVAPLETGGEADDETPLYAKWWLWTAVGAVVVVGVVLAIVFASIGGGACEGNGVECVDFTK